MEAYVEQSHATEGGVTLHTWTDVQGGKKAHGYITGESGTPVPAWCRAVLRQKHLADIVNFPSCPSACSDSRLLAVGRHSRVFQARGFAVPSSTRYCGNAPPSLPCGHTVRRLPTPVGTLRRHFPRGDRQGRIAGRMA
jgi:hypothetical protein